MSESIIAFARHLADRRSQRTAAAYVRVAAAFLKSVGSDMPGRSDVEAFLGRPRIDGARRSPAGRNQELAALRAFAAFARRDLGWRSDPTEGIPFLREPSRDPSVLTAFEVQRLFCAAAASQDGRRRALELAVLALLSQAALRVHELVRLDLRQVDLASKTLLAVRGKGGSAHDVPLNVPTVALLRAWVAERARSAAENETALFLSARASRLSIRSAQRLITDLSQRAKTAKRISPHVLRHTAATLALTMGADISTVAELLRHTDLNVTRRYLHLIDLRRREAVRRLGVTVPDEALRGCEPTQPLETDHEGSREDSRVFPLDVQHGLDVAA